MLRIYDATRGGAPLSSSDIAGALPIEEVAGKKRSAKRPEIDIEAATRIGDVALWITSHGRSSSARKDQSGSSCSAPPHPPPPARWRSSESPMCALLDDLSADARF